jgi:hypothetical protein
MLQNIPPMIAIGVLLSKLGGEVKISQADIDVNAFDVVLEGFEGQNLILRIVKREDYEIIKDQLPPLIKDSDVG